MCAYYTNIEKDTLDNKNYRKVMHTVPGHYFSGGMQLVVMSIPPKQDIHKEIHYNTTQFIKIEDGIGVLETWDNSGNVELPSVALASGVGVIIPPATYHRVVNVGNHPLKLYTIYSRVEHTQGLVQVKRPTNGD